MTLHLPSRSIPTVLAATSTTTKTSNRNELKLVSTLFKAGGADLNKATLSVSTIYRQRKQKIKIDATLQTAVTKNHLVHPISNQTPYLLIRNVL